MKIDKVLEEEISNLCFNFETKFILKHKTLYNIKKLSNRMIQDLYPQIIKCIIKNEDINSIKFLVKTLTEVYIKFKIAYDVLNKEFNYLEKSLLNMVLKYENCQIALDILKIFDELDILINEVFLNNHLKILIENNNLRLKTLHSSINDEMSLFYEAHIKWVNDLAFSILNKDILKLPEINPEQCTFGKWLHSSKGKKIINNREDFYNLVDIHEKLHQVSHVIYNLLKDKEKYSHEYLTYVYKAESLSKDIGMKLSTFSNEIIKNKATKDPLTGLLNRELCEDLFIKEYELHATTESNMLFAICDLDHFKNINDTYGHVAGDKVLKSFATLLQDSLRATDIIIRFGGEEFVLILPSAKLYQGVQILNDVRKKLEKQILFYEKYEIQVTVSMGVIELTPKLILNKEDIIIELENCLKQADVLLYKAKENGRNRIEV